MRVAQVIIITGVCARVERKTDLARRPQSKVLQKVQVRLTEIRACRAKVSKLLRSYGDISQLCPVFQCLPICALDKEHTLNLRFQPAKCGPGQLHMRSAVSEGVCHFCKIISGQQMYTGERTPWSVNSYLPTSGKYFKIALCIVNL